MNERTIEELTRLIDRRTDRDGAHPTALDELTLYRVSGPSEPVPTVHDPSLCLVAQGRKRIVLGGETYIYDPAQFLLLSVALPGFSEVIEATPDRPFLALRIGLDPGEVGQLIADLGPDPERVEAAAPCRGLAVSPLGPRLLDAVARLVALLDDPASIAVLAPLIRREIAYHLLAGDQGPRLRQIAAGDGQARRVVRAIRWLKAHYTEPLRIDELARRVALSPSALHHHFRAVTALSPLQYQKQLRLQEARRLLLAEGIDAAAAAYRVGYESASQFSREYRRLFGRPPGGDLRALRAEAGVAPASRPDRVP